MSCCNDMNTVFVLKNKLKQGGNYDMCPLYYTCSKTRLTETFRQLQPSPKLTLTTQHNIFYELTK